MPAAATPANDVLRSVAYGYHHESRPAARQLRLEFLVHALLQRRARERRVHADPAVLRVRFVGTDDAVALHCAIAHILDLERRAEEDGLRVTRYAFGNLQRRDAFGQ